MKIRNFKIYFLLAVFFLFFVPARVHSETPEEQRLYELRQNWKKARMEYRDALKSQKGLQDKQIEEAEESLEKENDQLARKKPLLFMKDLRQKSEELNDKIRAINAADLVKFSNNKNKVVSFLSGTE